MNALAPAVREVDSSGPLIRLLYCFVCKTIEELPDFEGNPDDDTLLQISLERHESAAIPHTGHLFKVAVKLWAVDEIRRKIIKQMREGSGGLAEIDPTFYDSRSTFAEDALRCYSAHLRPTDGCPDYMDDSKILLPKTAAARKEVGMPSLKETGGPKTKLCQFCPIHSVVMTKMRAVKGMYK